jgi:hypothetical protein
MSCAILCKQIKSIVVSKIFKLQNLVRKNVDNIRSELGTWNFGIVQVNYASDLYQNFLPIILFYSSHELMEKFRVFLEVRENTKFYLIANYILHAWP